MYCVWPPYIFRPTTRLAYCTVILRTPCVTAMTAAITMNRNATIRTRIAGLTWLVPVSAEGTKVFHACASAAGKPRDDADRDDERNAVADASLGDLIAQPHQKQRARGQRQHRDNAEGSSRDRPPAECPAWLIVSVIPGSIV